MLLAVHPQRVHTCHTHTRSRTHAHTLVSILPAALPGRPKRCSAPQPHSDDQLQGKGPAVHETVGEDFTKGFSSFGRSQGLELAGKQRDQGQKSMQGRTQPVL
eukprot:1159218-Pelagomonas_calceolata.AAC.8